jgi:SAM-dependent methyltransferase
MGRGRHALVLARAGYRVFGVDRRFDAVREAVARARAEGLDIHGWCADLTEHPLPRRRFDLVVVTRYLQRDLFAPIRESIVPGGVVVYETFTVEQRRHGTGPTSPDHLLESGELRERFAGFDVLFYEEMTSPEAVARLVARRLSASNAG